MKIVVIAGGNSSEREVSLRSGKAVRQALEMAGHEVDVLDPAVQELSKDVAARYAVAFPIIHGAGGEDGSLQKQLEDVGLAYVGSGISSSQLCFDKARYKRLLLEHGLPVAEGELVTADNIRHNPLVHAPFVLKPYNGGSSVDTFIIRDPDTTDWQAIDATLQSYDAMLLERLIEGVEITIGVLEDRALPVIEIIPPADGEFDYENKYNGATQELCPPQHVSESIQQRAQSLASRIHELCGCLDMSRTDMIVTPHNELIVLETNTLPGMTSQSLLPKSASVAGYGMSELCDHLVQLARARGTDAA